MWAKRGRQVIRHNYSKLIQGNTAQLSTNPKSWNEVIISTDESLWKNAAKRIKRSDLLQGRRIMKTKWVFKKKFNADGSVERYIARCTVKGFTLRKGIDFNETFVPTPRLETGRILLVVAHQFGWYRRQGDFPTVFHNPDPNIDL